MPVTDADKPQTRSWDSTQQYEATGNWQAGLVRCAESNTINFSEAVKLEELSDNFVLQSSSLFTSSGLACRSSHEGCVHQE